MTDPYSITLLNPIDVSFSRDSGGLLNANINNKVHKGILLYRTFPYSKPYEYISIRRNDDEELGIIRDLKQLDQKSEQEAFKELRLRYLIPVVTHIDSVKEEHGLWAINLKTDRGRLSLVMQNIHEHIQYTGNESILITDMEGRRCEIREVKRLDKNSLRELNKMI